MYNVSAYRQLAGPKKTIEQWNVCSSVLQQVQAGVISMDLADYNALLFQKECLEKELMLVLESRGMTNAPTHDL